MSREWLDKQLFILAEKEGSDLHIKVGSVPKIRINGELTPLDEDPVVPTLSSDIAREILTPDQYNTFMDNMEYDFAYEVENLGRFRVNIYHQRGTVSLVMRRISTSIPSIESLGLPDVIKKLSSEQRGLVLVTGPTGSGKTTTLASMIGFINNSRQCNIITLEDPIEVIHQDNLASINQREIGFDTKDFVIALRSAMRQDPDVIFVGEMRDTETVEAALRAAETGHLVLSTLHTVDSAETVNRVVDFFPPHQQNQIRVALAGVLKGIVSQRLIRTSDGKNRVASLEVLINNGRIQQCIIDPKKTGEIVEIVADGEYYGMQTFDQSLAKLFEDGKIDLKAAMTGASNPHDLRLVLQKKGLLGSFGSG